MSFFGKNRFKFGLFAINCAGGQTPSKAPERWPAIWDEMVVVAQMADRAGVEFILPVAKWHGFGGESNFQDRSFETFTQAAALGALTERIGMFVTAHVSVLTPAFVAKAISTVDHVTHGRAGLNVVCGWNPDEFSLHGVTIEGATRYERGLEWFEIYSDLVSGREKFDWDSSYFRLRGLVTDPLPVQRRPPVMAAGQSVDGQDFAARIADMFFTTMQSVEQVKDTCERVAQKGQSIGRVPDVYVQTQVVCRPTRAEAEEYLQYYAVEMADHESLEYFGRQKAKTLSKQAAAGLSHADRGVLQNIQGTAKRRYPGLFPGIYPLVGTPDDIVEALTRVADIGVSGSALIFLNYLQEMPFFLEEVLPRMERAGLRLPSPSPSR